MKKENMSYNQLDLEDVHNQSLIAKLHKQQLESGKT